MRRLSDSLIFKIGFIIVSVELIALLGMGYWYIQRFSDEVDRRTVSRIRIPGELMMQGVLSYESVNSEQVMEDLVGGELMEAMVIGMNQQVYYSLNPAHIGRRISEVAAVEWPDMLSANVFAPQVVPSGDGEAEVLVSLTPLRLEDGRLIGFLYIKSSLAQAQAKKRMISLLFWAGTAICVLATSAVEVLLMRRVVTRRIGDTLACVKRVEGGELGAAICRVNSRDEIGMLQEGINSMSAKLAGTVAQLGADIGQRERVEATLRESEERLAGFMASATDVFALFDSELNIVEVNEAGLRLSGRSREDLVGRHFSEVVPELRTSGRYSLYANVVRTGQPFYAEDVRVASAAGERRMAVKAFKVGDGMGLIMTDLTEIKEREEQVRQFNEELERRVAARTAELREANRELESFSYSVSHDLRAPLRIIDGFSKILLDEYGGAFDEEGRGYLERMRRNSQYMAQLIDDLLELARVTRMAMEQEQVDLSAMAQAIAEGFLAGQPEREAEFVIEPGLTVEGDSHLLRIVLENLLGNAWKFTAKTEKARIEFGLEASSNGRSFFVRDNGAGFDMAFSNKLFKPFERLHSVSEFEGTGVGLATVQRIIRRHGGSIRAEGRVGAGATFHFTL
ncbi:MAG: PAS domain-containing protein [Phycisphaerae bacterium]|nr:PAS domain-containing protein [Phycisphaerae bacterium]